MAKLLSYFNLCPIMDPQDFLGVADDKEDATIINTLGRNIIIVIKLNSQKQIKSWNSIDKLHTKVVYDKASDRYVGGFGNNYIKCWNESTEDLKKVKRIKTSKPIQDILSVEGSTVIVFTDGSCASLQNVLDNIKQPELYNWSGPLSSKEGKIVKVEAYPDGQGETILTIMVTNDKSETSLFYYKIPTDENAMAAPSTRVIRLTRPNVKYLNSCIVQGNSGLLVLSIWSDKRIMRQELREDVYESDVGQFMEMMNFVKLDESFSIVSPAKNYIAVYGGNVQQEGSSLMLYNIQYNLIEAKQQFKVLFNNSRLWSLGSNILLATGQSLSVIPFYIADEQLLHIIGTKKDTKDRQPIQNDMIDEANDEQNLIEFQKTIEAPKVTIEERDKPINCQEFDKIVDSFLGNPAVGVFEQEESETTTLVINEDPQEVLSITVRSLIKAMEVRGYSEMEITNEIIPNLISHSSTADLMTMLRRYSTFSESVIVDCLHWGIKEDNKSLLARVLSVDFEEEYMIYNLRKKLNIEEVQFLVEFLHDCLSGECPCPDVDDINLSEVVMKWFMCLIDAHYTNILMSKSKKMTEELKKWGLLIEKHIEELQHLSNFSALVERMARAKPVPEVVSGTSKWYSVSVVDLKKY